MIPVRLKKVLSPPSAASINKQFDFGTMVGLNKTVTQGQKGVVKASKSKFTTRGSWFEEQNKFGIRVKKAKKTDLSAEIRTNADWLQKQKEGGNIPGGKNVRTFHYEYGGVRYIAIPSRALRPHGSRKVIQKAVWPSTLRRKKGTFVILSRKSKTPILMYRFADGKDGYEAMYVLKPDVSIKATDTFYEPIENVVKVNLKSNIAEGIAYALKTAR